MECSQSATTNNSSSTMECSQSATTSSSSSPRYCSQPNCRNMLRKNSYFKKCKLCRKREIPPEARLCKCIMGRCHRSPIDGYIPPQGSALWPHADDCTCSMCKGRAMAYESHPDYNPYADYLDPITFPGFCLNCDPNCRQNTTYCQRVDA